MDYQKHYILLIQKYELLDEEQYGEVHHIVPRCIGGMDHKENLVKLSPEAHHTAHLLLVKIHNSNAKLVFAANAMSMDSDGNRIGNKRYGWIRRKFSEAIREYWDEEDNRTRQKNKASNDWNNKEYYDKQIMARNQQWYIDFHSTDKVNLWKTDKRREQNEVFWSKENREEQSRKMSKIRNTEEKRSEQSIISTKLWANIDSRERRIAAIKNAVSTDEVKEKKSVSMTALWANDDYKNQRKKKLSDFVDLKNIYIMETGYVGDRRKISQKVVHDFFGMNM